MVGGRAMSGRLTPPPTSSESRTQFGRKVVVGYHGTTEAHAREIMNRAYPIHNRREVDWLGDGLYFWQDAPHRALWWANRRVAYERGEYPERGPQSPAVLQVEVDFTNALDFLDRTPAIERLLRAAHRLLASTSPSMPANAVDRHALDCAVINVAVERQAMETGILHHCVRGIFISENPSPYYPGSALLKEAHVQFSVRSWMPVQQITLVDIDTLSRT